jgi:hypothetical protein
MIDQIGPWIGIALLGIIAYLVLEELVEKYITKK